MRALGWRSAIVALGAFASIASAAEAQYRPRGDFPARADHAAFRDPPYAERRDDARRAGADMRDRDRCGGGGSIIGAIAGGLLGGRGDRMMAGGPMGGRGGRGC